ncbi:hypothetical protein K440DRAFT_633952 [Wilcoxina mikolae CBS 423.85]|nr:hypothetical protein K440DRAFT_633952 [Wilcoxina mikolae CBS 423.85]
MPCLTHTPTPSTPYLVTYWTPLLDVLIGVFRLVLGLATALFLNGGDPATAWASSSSACVLRSWRRPTSRS